MNQFAKRILENTALCTVLALTALMLLGAGMAGAQNPVYLDDGAVNYEGGWDLPAPGLLLGRRRHRPHQADSPALHWASVALRNLGALHRRHLHVRPLLD